jgi:hypothetical protein
MKSAKAPELKPALVILYHGTNEEKAVTIRQKGQFIAWTYFAKNLHDALEFGGPVVFEVAFLKKDIPNNWQVRSDDKILTSRIVQITRFTSKIIFKNPEINDLVFESNSDNSKSDYTFYDNYSKYY